MKKIYALLLVFPFFYGTSLFVNTINANRAGAPAGHTGSPGDGKNCTTSGCHSDNSSQTGGATMLTSNVPTAGWEPGKEYEIYVKMQSTVGNTIGFQMCVQDDSKVHKGTLTADANSQLVGSGNNYATHTFSGANTNDITWTIKWKAPDDGTRKVTAYAAVNRANGTGDATGDDIFLKSLVLTANTTGIANAAEKKFEIYPNPCRNLLQIAAPQIANVRLRDLSGRVCIEKSAGYDKAISLDLSTLKNGTYLAEIWDKDGEIISIETVIKY
jgi:hypothetical protein